MAAALAATLPLAFAVTAQAAVELDQSQPAGQLRQSVQLMVQTFVAGKTGRLDHVDLKLSASYGIASVAVRLAKPDGTPVAPASTDPTVVHSGYVFGTYSFDFSKANIPVTKGATYEIFARTAGPVYWYYTGAPPAVSPTFLGGQLYVGCVGCPSWYSGTGYGADFVFATYVNTSTVQAPTITASTPNPVTVTEDTAPTASGTFSDPNGDAVTLSVTGGGTVTPASGTGSGTWSWTEPATEEAAGQQVMITVIDSHGLSASLPLTVKVVGAAPTAQIVTDPVSAPEGTVLSLAGTASSPDPTDSAAGFSYDWTVTRDKSPFQHGSGASFSFTVVDEATFDVTLVATDDGGMPSDPVTMTVVGTEVKPTPKIDPVKPTDPSANPLIFVPQESLSFAGSPGDSATDTDTAVWTFGDGKSATGFAAPHTYANAGTYTVTLTVTDDDKATGQTTTTVRVLTPQQVLSGMDNYIGTLSGLNAGQKNSLIAKLDAASASLSRGDTKTANNQMNAFLNELTAYQTSNKISAAAFNTLVGDVHLVQGAVGTYNRFLEWWPFLA